MALAVTAVGMISSVGRGAAGTCAAIRAGLNQPREIDFAVLDEVNQAPTAAVGHPVHGFTEGFTGLGRWLRLAEAAVSDLCEDVTVPVAEDASWQRTALIVLLPRLEQERYPEIDDGGQSIKEPLLGQLTSLSGLSLSVAQRHLITRGAAGAVLAIQHADQLLAGSSVDRVLLVAVDSLLDDVCLEWLNAHERLKTKANPVGTAPGEAAVALLLETPTGARRRRVPPRAIIEAVAFDQEPNHFFSGNQNHGVALARAVRAAVVTALPQGNFAGDVVLDLNGEVWRAAEWGMATTRLSDVLGPKVKLVLPAGSVGDVGAASSLLGVAVAAHGFARPSASTAAAHALVVASSEHGDVGAIVLRAERQAS